LRTPTLLLHGFTGSADAWPRPVLDALAAAGNAPVALDLPGHGQRAGETDPARFTMDAVTGELLAAADGATGAGGDPVAATPAVDLVGYSMGGRVALAFAVAHPARVRRLVLESASPGLETEEERAARRGADARLAAKLEQEGIAAFVAFWERLPLFTSQRNLPAPVAEAQRRRRLRNDPRSLAASLRGLGAGALPSFWDDLPALHIPTMVLAGEDDVKFMAVARRMAALLPAAALRIIPGAGHNVHLERPGAWVEAVTEFLRPS